MRRQLVLWFIAAAAALAMAAGFYLGFPPTERGTDAIVGAVTKDGLPKIDFDKDRRADVFWYQPATGATSTWLMKGGTRPDYVSHDAVPLPSGWSFLGYGDFDGDGATDLFWHNDTTGETSAWLMNGSSAPTYATYENVPISSGWTLQGFGDFNADDHTDIFWHNRKTGETSAWLMNGSSLPTTASFAPVPISTGWTVQGIGYFNADRRADIFWHNARTGETSAWFMNGAAAPTSFRYPGKLMPGEGWAVQGVGDFNNDRRSDIFWTKQETGDRLVWLLDGTKLTPWHHGKVSLADGWTLQGFGDFDASGSTDVFWYNRGSGETVAWLMNGSRHDSVYYHNVPVTSGWVLQSIGDFDNDDRADLLWYNIEKGATSAWLMNGKTVKARASYDAVPSSSGWLVGGPRTLRLHVIPVSDGDIGYGRTFTATPAQVTLLVNASNAAFSAAGLRFTFDESTDWEPIADTALNSLMASTSYKMANQIAARQPGQVTVFLRWGPPPPEPGPTGNAFAFPPDTGAPVPAEAQLNSANVNFIAFSNYIEFDSAGTVRNNSEVFVHELGHYLGLFHTFPGWFDAKNDAAYDAPGAVKARAEARIAAAQLSGAPGETGLDGDLIADTAPDAGAQYYTTFISADACASQKTYVISGLSFTPDRQNIMSYFGSCQPPHRLSPQQAQRIRATLRHVSRQRLGGARSTF